MVTFFLGDFGPFERKPCLKENPVFFQQPVFKDLETQFREATEAYDKTKKNIVGE